MVPAATIAVFLVISSNFLPNICILTEVLERLPSIMVFSEAYI